MRPPSHITAQPTFRSPPFTPGLRFDSAPRLPAIPDGSAVFASVDSHWFRFPLNGGLAVPVKGLELGERILQSDSDGKHVYVGRRTLAGSYRIFKADPGTGGRVPLTETSSLGPVNFDAYVTPDGTTIAYPSATRRSNLYLLTGVR
jgi:hypothetical protein